MQIKLIRLELKNFKSVANFSLNLDGHSATISAQNGAGKTTIADAFFWLLTGSDSAGRAKFGIITQDSTGHEKQGLEAVVSAELSIDGDKINLERRLCQKWTKKRGQAEQEFSGHETKFRWDDVPIKKKEFDAKLSEIIPANLVRVLADVHYFNATLKPDARRNILLDLLGSIDDEKIIEAYPELKDLPEIMGDKSPDDAKKVAVARRKAANALLRELPTRIDTLKKSVPDKTGDEAELKSQLDTIDYEIAGLKAKKSNLGTDIGRAEKEKEILRLEADMANIENQLANNARVETIRLKSQLSDNQSKIDASKKHIEMLQKNIAMLQEDIAENEKKRAELAADYKAAKIEIFQATEKCYACGSPLTQGLKDKQEHEFNRRKSEAIKSINAKGQALFAEFEKIKKRIDDAESEINRTVGHISRYEGRSKEIKDKIHKINNSCQAEMDEKTADIATRLAELSAQLAGDDGATDDEKKVIDISILNMNTQKEAVEKQIRQIERAKDIEPQVEEYQRQLTIAASEYENAERAIYLLEQYSMRRAEFVEDSVSDKFSMVKWRLFDMQINEGIKEICEATVGGIDYSTNLNTGAKINAGLDCINVLSQHYKIEMPIFVDNAESVTSWLDSGRQIIRLVADGNYKKLEVNNATTPLPDYN